MSAMERWTMGLRSIVESRLVVRACQGGRGSRKTLSTALLPLIAFLSGCIFVTVPRETGSAARGIPQEPPAGQATTGDLRSTRAKQEETTQAAEGNVGKPSTEQVRTPLSRRGAAEEVASSLEPRTARDQQSSEVHRSASPEPVQSDEECLRSLIDDYERRVSAVSGESNEGSSPLERLNAIYALEKELATTCVSKVVALTLDNPSTELATNAMSWLVATGDVCAAYISSSIRDRIAAEALPSLVNDPNAEPIVRRFLTTSWGATHLQIAGIRRIMEDSPYPNVRAAATLSLARWLIDGHWFATVRLPGMPPGEETRPRVVNHQGLISTSKTPEMVLAENAAEAESLLQRVRQDFAGTRFELESASLLEERERLVVGKAMPDITDRGTDGSTIQLSALGSPVLVIVWDDATMRSPVIVEHVRVRLRSLENETIPVACIGINGAISGEVLSRWLHETRLPGRYFQDARPDSPVGRWINSAIGPKSLILDGRGNIRACLRGQYWYQFTSEVKEVAASGGEATQDSAGMPPTAGAPPDDGGEVRGRLVRLGQPVRNKELLLGARRPIGKLFSLADRPQGTSIVTDMEGNFRAGDVPAGELALYDVVQGSAGKFVYEPITWFDGKIKDGGKVQVSGGPTVDLGVMNYVPMDVSRVSPGEGENVESRPRITWGPYPGATSYRVILVCEPWGVDFQYGLASFQPDRSTVLFLPSTTDVSFQPSNPLPTNLTGPGAIQSLLVYYLSDDVPIAIAHVQFAVVPRPSSLPTSDPGPPLQYLKGKVPEFQSDPCVERLLTRLSSGITICLEDDIGTWAALRIQYDYLDESVRYILSPDGRDLHLWGPHLLKERDVLVAALVRAVVAQVSGLDLRIDEATRDALEVLASEVRRIVDRLPAALPERVEALQELVHFEDLQRRLDRILAAAPDGADMERAGTADAAADWDALPAFEVVAGTFSGSLVMTGSEKNAVPVPTPPRVIDTAGNQIAGPGVMPAQGFIVWIGRDGLTRTQRVTSSRTVGTTPWVGDDTGRGFFLLDFEGLWQGLYRGRLLKVSVDSVVTPALLEVRRPKTTADPHTLTGAMALGLVEARFHGQGACSGDTIIVRVSKTATTGGGRLELSIERGTVLRSSVPSQQDMVVASVRGKKVDERRFVSEKSLVLVGHEPVYYVLEAYCVDMEKDNPASSTALTPDSVDASLANLLEEGARRGSSVGVIQTAVWILTDQATYEEVSKRISLNVADWNMAQELAMTARKR